MKVIPPYKIPAAFSDSWFANTPGYYYNHNGDIAVSENSQPRYSFDPAHLNIPPILLIENTVTNNYLTFSEDLTNAAWTKTRSTINATAVIAPDTLSVTKNKLIEDSTVTNTHGIGLTTSRLANLKSHFNLYAKAAEYSKIIMYISDSGTPANQVKAVFDLTAVTATAVNVGAGTQVSARIQSIKNGFFRCFLSGIPGIISSVANASITVNLINNSGQEVFTGTSTNGLFLWGLVFQDVESMYLPSPMLGSPNGLRMGDSALTPVSLGVYRERHLGNYSRTVALYSSATTYYVGNVIYTAATATGEKFVYTCIKGASLNNTPPVYFASLGYSSASNSWWDFKEIIYNNWSAATTYALGYKVVSGGNVYESLVASNLNNSITDTTKWLLLGAINSTAAFSYLGKNPSVDRPSFLNRIMAFSISPGLYFDSCALINVLADAVMITAQVGSVETYRKVFTINQSANPKWLDYVGGVGSLLKSFALFDLPTDFNQTITVTIIGTGIVECGAFVIGASQDIGGTKYHASNDALNFSTITRDFAGSIQTLVQRRNVPKIKLSTLIDKADVSNALLLRDLTGGTPVIWAGSDVVDDVYSQALLMLGLHKQFGFDLSYPEHSILSIEVESV